MKGAGAGAAAKQGGAAAVHEYMKQPKETGTGAGAPMKGEGAEPEEAPADAPRKSSPGCSAAISAVRSGGVSAHAEDHHSRQAQRDRALGVEHFL
jgi:hypothetical protein